MDLSSKAFDVAKKEIGTKEGPGEIDSPKVINYFSSVDLGPEMSHDSTAWCSIFVNWCIQQAGGHGTRSAWARNWLNWGKASSGNPGDVVVLSRGPVSGHVGFLVEKGLVTVKILGGNQSDQVSIAVYPKWKVLGYRRSYS